MSIGKAIITVSSDHRCIGSEILNVYGRENDATTDVFFRLPQISEEP